MRETDPAALIRIDIVSDVTCPWCYIGKHQLEAAIASYASASGLDVDLHWRPFQIDPAIPEDGFDLRAYIAQRQNEEDAFNTRMLASELGRELGLTFAWDKITRMPNTRAAHRLIHHATLYGVQSKIVERLFKAYFTEGIDVGDRDRLSELAEDCGIDGYAIDTLFGQQNDSLMFEEELAKTRQFGLPKVPLFVFADEIVVPGAASQQLFTAALFRAQDMQRDLGAPQA